jgi:hypothetical protein
MDRTARPAPRAPDHTPVRQGYAARLFGANGPKSATLDNPGSRSQTTGMTAPKLLGTYPLPLMMIAAALLATISVTGPVPTPYR